MDLELHFDLTKQATRKQILDTVISQLGEKSDQVLEEFKEINVKRDHHHTLAEVKASIDALPLSDQAKEHTKQVYAILAHAEAKVHECSIEDTHFHEVGKGSAVENTACICHAIDSLKPQKITATAVQIGKGKIQCAHGLMDIPAPATAAILSLGIPICDERLEGERCTPTSAALIKHYVEEWK